MKQLITMSIMAAMSAFVVAAQTADSGPVVIKHRVRAMMGMMGAVVKGEPYSAEVSTENNQTLGDGTHIRRQESYKIYRDGEGRIRRESGNEIWISDPVANTSYVLDTGAQTVHKMGLAVPGEKMPMPPPPAGGDVVYTRRVVGDGPLPPPPPGPGQFFFVSSKDAKPESLGKQVMVGVEVEGTRTTTVIPEGQIGNDRPMQIVHEVWKSPELQVVMYSKHTDPQMGEMTERVTSLQRGEPDPALFTVPAGYQVEK